jgi:hypothetical protein
MSMQTDVTVSINGAEPVPAVFTVTPLMIDASSFTASKPDMRWEFTDAAGHYHAYDHSGELPTIVRREEFVRVERHADDEDDWDDGYTVTHIECALCGASVAPERVPDDPHRMIPGRTDYRLTLHTPIPDGKFSVRVEAGDRVWFGIAEGRWVGAYEVTGHGQIVDTYEAWCGQMTWRKRAPRSRVHGPRHEGRWKAVIDLVVDDEGHAWVTADGGATELHVRAGLIPLWAHRYPDRITRRRAGRRIWYLLADLQNVEAYANERLTRQSAKRVDA